MHIYGQAGIYTATLTVTDALGRTSQSSDTVTISSATVDSAPYITTPYLKIPNFGANPTIVSIQSGNWSNPATWSLGRLPQVGDIVDINPNTTVAYDVNSTVAAARTRWKSRMVVP